MSKKVNKEGLGFPSIDALLDKYDSKYKLVYASAMRAKQMDIEMKNQDRKDEIESETISVTPVGRALEEILQDKVHVEFEQVDYKDKKNDE